jgi:septal ring factor EnvC (AmiA/AmiB activator)
MLGLIAGTLATVLAASAPLVGERGSNSADPGQAIAAAPEATLVVASPQDAEALLKRLEQLAARVAKLEDEIGRLETTHKQLKEQLQTSGVAGAGAGAPGASVRVNPAPGSAVPGQPRNEK